jgi:hypothetical protein
MLSIALWFLSLALAADPAATARHDAAMAALRSVQARYDAFVTGKIVHDDKQETALIARKRDVELSAVRDAALGEMRAFDDIDGLSAAFYLRAEALLYVA